MVRIFCLYKLFCQVCFQFKVKFKCWLLFKYFFSKLKPTGPLKPNICQVVRESQFQIWFSVFPCHRLYLEGDCLQFLTYNFWLLSGFFSPWVRRVSKIQLWLVRSFIKNIIEISVVGIFCDKTCGIRSERWHVCRFFGNRTSQYKSSFY